MTVKIHSGLYKNAHNDPTKETLNKSISQICDEVNKGQIVMPVFQRDLAWTTEKKVALYNFQLNGSAPVSPVSMNKIGEKSLDMPHVTLLTRTMLAGEDLKGNLSVIDGQQRISTNYQAYVNDESIRSIVLDISRGRFMDIGQNDIKVTQIPVGILYNKNPRIYTDYIKVNPKLSGFEVSSVLNQVRTKFFNYFYTVNFAQDLPGNQQIEWFDVLNLAGSRVPEIQMKLTRLQVNGLDFYKEYAKVFQEKMELNGLDELFVQKSTEVSIPLATLNPSIEIVLGKAHSSNYSPMASDKKESVIVDLSPDNLRKCFKMTLSALDRAIDFINNNGLTTPSKIDYVTYLTGYFVYKNGEPLSQFSKQNLIEWYLKTEFGNKSNSERRKIFNDLLML